MTQSDLSNHSHKDYKEILIESNHFVFLASLWKKY